MKVVLLAALLLACVSRSAFAAGADLSFVACPGNAGASSEATLDCAGGTTTPLYVTFMPAEAISDLVAVDLLLDLVIAGGDVGTTASFWDFSTANTTAIQSLPARPAAGCENYTDAWGVANSGAAWAAAVRTQTQVRLAAVAYRPSNLGVISNQRVFGIELLLDSSGAIQAGGTLPGCPLGACLVLVQALPQSAAGAPTTMLWGPSVFGGTVRFNGGASGMCFAVPAVRHTWGQLKSLYR